MKKVEFECNLCGDVYKKSEARHNMKAYCCVRQQFPTGSVFEIRSIDAQCDRHICNSCIETIKKHDSPPTF